MTQLKIPSVTKWVKQTRTVPLFAGFVQNLTHTKDKWAGQAFNPRPWQVAIIREVFGRMRVDDPTRRAYRTAYIEIPRKNGKSEIAAALALYCLVGDGVVGAEVYSAAADREQAALVFNVAADGAERSGAVVAPQDYRLTEAHH